MKDPEDRPEPDRRSGAPHPRMVEQVVGHAQAKEAFGSALAHDMPHAWLLAGPRGVGKATFAWSAARQLLGAEDDEGTARRILALSEPRLTLVRRGWDDKAKRLKTQITADEVRRLAGFLSMAPPGGGRRVVILDDADAMNLTAANAILKMLEEPPADTVFLVVSHNPAGLLPTIRSRCRVLRFAPLSPPDMMAALAGIGMSEPNRSEALSALSQGSVGTAVGLIEQDGLSYYDALVALLVTCPDLDRSAALGLIDGVSGRGNEEKRDLLMSLIEVFMARVALYGAGAAAGPEVSAGETALLARFAPHESAARIWARLLQTVGDRSGHALAVNLDPAGVILDMLLSINETAGRVARP